MSKARSMLRGMAGGGGGGGSFWRPNRSGDKKFLRLYRFGDEKELCIQRFLHWGVLPKGPLDCDGSNCEACQTVARLYASGTEDDKKKAQRIKQKQTAIFVIVDADSPTGFNLWDAPQTASQGMFAQIAKAGGRMGVDYPNQKASEEEWEEFEECFMKGLDKVCGPNGRDMYIVFNPKASPAQMYSVDMRMDGNKVLPFEEDETVINPVEVLAKMAAGKDDE